MTHRFINADGLVSTGTGILGHNMFAYCDNNPVNCSDPTGESKHYPAGFIGPVQPGDTVGGVKFVAADYKVGKVEANKNDTFPLFYTKVGYYNVSDYSNSCFSVYAFYNYDDFWQSECGVEILNGFSFSLGFENVGLQLPIPFTDVSIETSLSLMEGCVRVGWDTTHQVGEHFIVGGGGIEINYFDAAVVGVTVIGALTLGDKIISLSPQIKQASYAFNGGWQ